MRILEYCKTLISQVPKNKGGMLLYVFFTREWSKIEFKGAKLKHPCIYHSRVYMIPELGILKL